MSNLRPKSGVRIRLTQNKSDPVSQKSTKRKWLSVGTNEIKWNYTVQSNGGAPQEVRPQTSEQYWLRGDMKSGLLSETWTITSTCSAGTTDRI